jgi:hypothetical protein
MRIQSFQFHDRTTGWKLEETTFDPFNLLVGVSGVGKTKILAALQQVQGVALGTRTVCAEWSIHFEHDGQEYEWQALTSDADAPRESVSGDGPTAASHVFVAEKITSGSLGTLVLRDGDSFIFETTNLPKLKRSDSAITLLAEESRIAPIRAAFRRLVFSESGDRLRGELAYARAHLVPIDRRWDMNEIREAFELPTAVQAYLTRQSFHLAYLQEMLQEQGKTYSKAFPGVVLEANYLEALRQRCASTCHLPSLKTLLSTWTSING